MHAAIPFVLLRSVLPALLLLPLSLLAQGTGDGARQPPSVAYRLTPLGEARNLAPGLRRAITLDLVDVPIAEAIAAIERRSGLAILRSSDDLPRGKRVTLQADRMATADALTRVVDGTDVGVFVALNGQVVLTKHPGAAGARAGQAGTVVGLVTDTKTDQGIAGVDVSLEGGRWKATTGEDGRFRLADVAPGTYTLVTRRIGYGPERRAVTVAAGQAASVDVTLQPAATKLGEVIVTAQKREERLQDVPLSIAIVSPEEIDRRGLVSAEDYLRGIPGVNQVSTVAGQAIVIRGIETNTGYQNFFSGTTVATYFGETPTSNSGGLGGGSSVDAKLVDIERVEVLRGPQGTSFGSSSLGGAVRTIPVAPKLDRVEGKVAGGYSGTAGPGSDNYNLQGVANVPLITDKLGLRATGYRFEESGFYRNVAGSDPTFQSRIAAFGAQAYATDAEEVGASRFTGGRIAALFRPSDVLSATLSYVKQKTELDGEALAHTLARTGAYAQAVMQVAPEHVLRGQTAGVFDTDFDLANATMEYDLGWANVLATYSHLKSGSMSTIPFTSGNPTVPLPYSSRRASGHREHSGEMRLTTQLNGAWNFLVGLYAEDLEDTYHADHYWYGNPDLNFFFPGQRFVGSNIEIRNVKQKAAFAEVSWEFLADFTLTGGVRAYDYDRVGRNQGLGPLVGQTSTTVSTDASGTSFRGNLSHKLTDDAMVYAGWAQGFRLGKPQPGLAPGLCDRNGDGIVDGTSSTTIESTRRLESDGVDSYEVGGKFTLFDRRLMIAADVYRIDWSGLPITVISPGTRGSTDGSGCGTPYLANAGAARSEGLEFQANFYVTDALRVDLGGSWIRARLTADAPALNAFAGDRLPGSPEINANLGVQYEFAIGGNPLFVRVDPIYVGPFYGGIFSESEAANLVGAGDYVKVDASTRVALRNTSVDLFVRNLTNEDKFTTGGEDGLTGYRLRPRTVGLQLSRAF